MEKARNFTDLIVWQKAHKFVLSAYHLSDSFPKSEIYGLTSQLRRAAVSIPANIAEGCGRTGEAEMKRFLQIAQGSASELEYHLILAKELSFLKGNDYESLSNQLNELRKMLTVLIQKLKTKMNFIPVIT